MDHYCIDRFVRNINRCFANHRYFRLPLIYSLLIIILLFNHHVAMAAPGDLDTGFGTGGIVTTAIGTGNDYAYSLAIQSDGKIIAAGCSNNGTDDFSLARYNSDGTLDTTFDGDGLVTTAIGSGTDRGLAAILQSDGRIVLAGYSNNGTYPDFALARYNSDGSLDTTFDGDGITTLSFGVGDDMIKAVVQQSDGRLVVTGRALISGSDYHVAVVRYNTDGSLDTTFDGDGIVTTGISSGWDQGEAVVLQSDGKIVVAGYASRGSGSDFFIARYNTNGSLDTTFGTAGITTTDIGGRDDQGMGMAMQSDGKFVVAGYSNNGSDADFAVVRYKADGSLDTTFGNGGIVTTSVGAGEDWGYGVAMLSDGKIVVAGYSNNGSKDDIAVVRYNTNGSLDTSFGSGGIVTTAIGAGGDRGQSVALQSDGKIVVAGFSNNGANDDYALVRYLVSGSGTVVVGDGGGGCFLGIAD